MPRPWAHSSSVSISSSLTPLSATVLILTLRPASCAASMPCITLVEIAPAGDARGTCPRPGIEGDIDPPHAAGGEVPRIAGKLRAVGGDGELVEGAGIEMAREGAEQGHDVPPHQGLAAGDAQLAHALRDEGRADPVELLEGQKIALGQEGHVLGHAIDAAEIAAVRHRDAQIGDRPAKRVQQGPAGIGILGMSRKGSHEGEILVRATACLQL